MRTIIAGSRGFTDYRILVEIMAELEWNPSVVISGAARGVDALGERWAMENNVPIERYPAQWNKYGRSAGPIRNKEMAKASDALVAIWDGKSNGTKYMIELAHKNGLKIYVHRF